MAVRTIGVAVNGVTGRMGYRQHLVRSLLPLRDEGVRLPDGTVLKVEPVLVGRNADKLKEIAERHDLARWTTDLDAALADPSVEIYFDSQVTSRHVESITKALEAGKHVYTEKPVSRHRRAGAGARRAWPRRTACGTAWWRTSCTCRASASSSG